MNNYTPHELKLFLHHTLKQDLISKIEPEDFKDNPDIQIVYSIIKAHYSNYQSVPGINTIMSEILKSDLDINGKTVQLMLSSEEYDNTDGSFIKERFRHWLATQRTSNSVLKMIDDVNHNIISLDVADQILNDEPIQDEKEVLRNTPTIPESVHSTLPKILKEMLDNFTDKREKDTLLTSEIVVLSSVFPTISGVYWFEECFSNLYAFIAAPAGSSKGVMKFASHSLNDYKRKLKEEYCELNRLYDSKSQNPPPVERRHQIPANASSAAFVDSLSNNNGVGLIFETEANALTDNNKNEWGNYNTQLRAAFHHEPITLLRKDVFVDIEKPKLSVLISGTLRQMVELIVSPENGLFSRFIYYVFENDLGFLNPFDGINRTAYFTSYSRKISEVIDFFSNRNITFSLSKKQGEAFTEFFIKQQTALKSYYEDGDIDGMVKRFGAITFRIMMLLSILRKYERVGKAEIFEPIQNLECLEQDFQNALEMIKVYITHSELVFNNLLKHENVNVKGLTKRDLIDMMPETFKRCDILKKAKELSIAERSADRILKKLLENEVIVKLDRYTYKKVIAAKK